MNIEFESKNIYFVRVSASLVDEYLKMVNDIEHVGKLIGRTEAISKDKEIKWVNKKLDAADPIYSMIEKKTGLFIGNVEFMENNGIYNEFGIAITKEMQENGFGTEAINAMIDFGFKTFSFDRIILKAFLFNDRAIHVYKKCGFKEYKKDEKEIYMEVLRSNYE